MTWPMQSLDAVLVAVEYGTSRPVSPTGDRPIVGMREVNGGRVVTTALASVDDDASLAHLVLQPHDILLNRTNSPARVGKVGIVTSATNAVFASYLVRLVPDKIAIDPSYLFACLSSDPVQARIRRLATRAVSQSNINPTVLRKSLQVPVPPLPEQRKIAEILHTWDDAIENLTRTRKLRSHHLRNLVHRVFDPKRDDQDSQLNLGDLFTERAERVGESASAGLPLLSVTQGSGVVRQDQVGRKDSSSADRSQYKLARSGDFAYNTMRMWQGASGLVPEDGLVSPAYTVIIPKLSAVHPAYASHLLKSPRLVFDFQRYSQGLTSDTWTLKFPAFASIPVSVPNNADQLRAARALDAMQEEVALLDRKIELLREQKRGLAQKLLSGEIRVNTDEKPDNA